MAERFTLTPVDEEPLRLTPVEDFKLTPVEDAAHDTRLADFMAAPDIAPTETSPVTTALATPSTDQIIRSEIPQDIPHLTASELEATLFAPQFQIPESIKEAAAASTILGQLGQKGRELARGIEDTAAGLIETAPSPGGLALLGAQAIPGLNVALDTALAGTMVKSGAEKLGEASVTKDLREAGQGAAELLAGFGGAGLGIRGKILERRAALAGGETPPVIPSPEGTATKSALADGAAVLDEATIKTASAAETDASAPPPSPLTEEAQDLLRNGGTPTVVTRNLRRIAEENGIEVTDETTPNDIVAQLRDKAEPVGPGLTGMGGALEGEVSSVGEGADIYGIAQRVREQRAAAGQTELPPRGEGISAEASVARGRELLAAGADPEAAVKAFEERGDISHDSMALVRAKGENLAQEARRVEDQFGTDSDEYRAAYRRLADWDARIKPMQTESHKIFQAQQGATDIDTGTFTGLQRAYTEGTGEDFTPEQATTARRKVKANQAADAEAGQAQEALRKRVATKAREADAELAARKAVHQAHAKAAAHLADLERKQMVSDQQRKVELARIEREKAAALQKTTDAIQRREIIRKAKEAAQAEEKRAASVKEQAASQRRVEEKVLATADKLVRERAMAAARDELKASASSAKNAKEAEALQQRVEAKALEAANEAARMRGIRGARAAAKELELTLSERAWKRANEYIEQAAAKDEVPNFDDIRHKLAADLGTSVDQVIAALGKDKRTKFLMDEAWKKQETARRLRDQARNWVIDQQIPGWQRFIRSIPRALFIDKVFGHGATFMVTHAGINMFNPFAWKAYWPNFFRQFRIAFSSAAHERLMQDLVRDPNWTRARRAGLLNDPFRYNDDFQSAFAQTSMGKVFNKLAGGHGADALKLFRQARFNEEWGALKPIQKTPEMAELLANGINHASGSVQRPFREWANWTFFAPKLEGSRWAWMFSDPAKAIAMMAKGRDMTAAERRFVANQFKEKAAIAGTYFGLLAVNQGLLDATGSDQKINFTDPTKSDFLAFKVAGHKLGIITPMVGMVRLLADLAIAATSSSKKAPDAKARIADYARGKLAPGAGQIANVLTQTDFMKRPVPWSSKPPERKGIKPYTYGEYFSTEFTPIPMSEVLREIWQHQGMDKEAVDKALGALAVGATAITGARLTTEPKK